MHVLVARLPGRYESRTDMKVKGDHDRPTGREPNKDRGGCASQTETGPVDVLTRGEDENAIDLSSIVLPDHVLRALISIDLLSLSHSHPSLLPPASIPRPLHR